jgi:hypothetical protein
MSLLNAIVQFIRNFLCCIKDISYGSQPNDKYYHYVSWLYDTNITNQYIHDYLHIQQLIEPLYYTTPLEAFISIAQLYVVVTGVPESIQRFIYSYQQMNRSLHLIQTRQKNIITNHAERLIHVSLLHEAYYCIRSMIIAFNCFFICISFIWLSANSWHITNTNWIGGLPALIHALTVMNICLLPILYYMYQDSLEYFRNAKRIQTFHQQLLSGSITNADIGLSAIQALYNYEYIPFWSCNYTDTTSKSKNSITAVDDVQLLNKEIRKVKAILDVITGTTAAKKKTDQLDGNNNNSNNNIAVQDEMNQIRTKIQNDLAITIQPNILKLQLYGIRELIYLVINTIAWYGYGMCIIVYYYPIVLQQPDYIRILLLYYHNDDADWYGNFAGDVMWTIEPIIIIISPIIINVLTRKRQQHTTTTTSTTSLPPIQIQQPIDDEKTKTE